MNSEACGIDTEATLVSVYVDVLVETGSTSWLLFAHRTDTHNAPTSMEFIYFPDNLSRVKLEGYEACINRAVGALVKVHLAGRSI